MSNEIEGRYHKHDIQICQFLIDIAYDGDYNEITLSKEKFKELREFCKKWDEYNP
jgi:hypothetical protein